MPDAQGGVQTLPLAPEHLPTVQRALAGLVGALAEIDEQITNAFLREQEVTSAALRAAIRRQTLAGRFVPIIGGSAFKNVGVPALLDAVVAYLTQPAG